jgi:hypothetical protein
MESAEQLAEIEILQMATRGDLRVETEMNMEFQRFTWLTPFQLRDFYLVGTVTTALVQEAKVAALHEQARRKQLPAQFVECPRCRGFHSEQNNMQNLCERCEQMVHVMEFDQAAICGLKLK